MELIEKCTRLTGYFASRKLTLFQKFYEFIWTASLLVVTFGATASFYFNEFFTNAKLSTAVQCAQGFFVAFRVASCAIFIKIAKNQHLDLMDEGADVEKWFNVLMSKASVTMKPQFTAKKFTKFCFLFPILASVVCNAVKLILPLAMQVITIYNATPVGKNNTPDDNGGHPDLRNVFARVIMLILIIITAGFVMILKLKCTDFIVFKPYIQIIHHTESLTTALQATFSEKREFFQKFNLAHWLKCKEKLVEFTSRVNSYFSTCIVTVIVVDALNMCCSSYMASKNSKGNVILQISLSTSFVESVVSSLVYCYVGQQLKNRVNLLCNAIYRVPVLSVHGVGHALHFAAIDCAKSLVATGGPFFHLSMEFFTSLLGVVLTYFVVLFQFND